MSIRTVQAAIRHVREVEAEWKEADLGHWLENHTRYALIDPVIRALGWKTCDPKECHSEYRRSNEGQKGMADYVLFGTPDLEDIGNGDAVPDIIIESKSLYGRLDGNVEQLQRYVEGVPRMRKGRAVLTNGGEWWVYDVSRRGDFSRKLVEQVDILTGNQRLAAQTLNCWLSRRNFG
jgi:predicted type IV restriction endonuclease